MRVPNEIRPIVRRASMPQLDAGDYTALMVAVGDSHPDILWEAGYIDPHHLYFHQDIDPDRAMQMSQFNAAKPVLISRDLAIFDGNHRAWRNWQAHELQPYVKLNGLFLEWLPFLRRWASVYSQKQVEALKL